MLKTVRKLSLSSLFEEYGIVAGQLSTEGSHLEPNKFIKALLMEEEYPIHIVRAFLNNFYESEATEAFLSELYSKGG